MKNHNQKRILFLLKKGVDSAGGAGSRAGLFSAARFVADYLNKELHYQAFIDITTDGNSITHNVKKFSPDIVVLEAIWCPPESIEKLIKIYPHIQWIVRVHSKIPFLANEGIAIEWLREYGKIPNTTVAFNNLQAAVDWNKLGYESLYLPNIYYPNKVFTKYKDLDEWFEKHEKENEKRLDVGCFGAIRPMKNQLEQAFAAIEYATAHRKSLYFHINVNSKEESENNEIIKNLRALFDNSGHHLVGWPWYDHLKFRYLISKMDFGMQVSLSESFNIVTADFVDAGVPIVASKDISWMPAVFCADPSSTDDMREKIKTALLFPALTKYTNRKYLAIYNSDAARVWDIFLKFYKF